MPVRKVISSPLGALLLLATDAGIRELRFGGASGEPAGGNPHLDLAERELHDYFAGSRAGFSVPLDPAGTPFQHAVWRALASVAFGQTVTYGQLARTLGAPGGSQAVGRANGANPLPILLPCHRVLGASGKLTGYSGGIERKKWLLRHESASLF